MYQNYYFCMLEQTRSAALQVQEEMAERRGKNLASSLSLKWSTFDIVKVVVLVMCQPASIL